MNSLCNNFQSVLDELVPTKMVSSSCNKPWIRKKKFFHHNKSFGRDSKEIPILEKDGREYSTDFTKANILIEYFYSVLIKDDDTTLPDMGNILNPDMPTVEIETAGIAKLLREIDPHKVMGPNELPPKLLKELCYDIACC